MKISSIYDDNNKIAKTKPYNYKIKYNEVQKNSTEIKRRSTDG